ncbi:GNAT family N-acetyltransferase [Paenibacillus hamazuiensis]|uniref:GNAT family N-acetyltransferase n=1 Tax=Paenibacillus hamazuiensis TaxID=2936508 RepID=UPI00200E2F48|nr:GNAT family N-acetyltransferase [Paenibacillus hamazuiensis]
MEIKRIGKELTWPIRHMVMWPDKDIEYVKLKDDESGLHYGLFAENKLVSVVSLFIGRDEAQFRKFATLPEEQGKGYGSKLLQHVLDEMQASGVRRIWCNARRSKAGYYARFGLRETADVFNKDGVEYVIMEMFPPRVSIRP